MKKSLVLGLGLVLVAANQVAAQPQFFFPTDQLPPPNSVYISPAQWHALYANGIIISNVSHRAFTYSSPPPPAGTSATHTFNSELDFDLSLDRGATFTRVTAPAQVTVNLQPVGGSGGVQVYNTEILQLDASGGTLPQGVQIRASRSSHSSGQTTVSIEHEGFLVSSFFDVFTDVSLDGGRTWSASTQAGHMEMRGDPTQIPALPEPTSLVPPPGDEYLMPTQTVVAFASGIVLKDVRDKFFTQSLDPLMGGAGGGLTLQCGSTADFQLSMDGGNSFSPVRAPAQITVTMASKNPGPPQLFDTEMTQLDIAFGGSAAPLMIRESPTLPSYGETAIQSATDGTFRISSFFDIFIELSQDGGQTWQTPSNGPVHLEAQRPSILTKQTSPNLPPSTGQFGPASVLQYPGGIWLCNAVAQQVGPALAPPPPGQRQIQEFAGNMSLMVSLNNGQSFMPATAPLSGTLVISNRSSAGSAGAQYYDTELQQMNLSGGTLPQGIMVRESPSKASLGRTQVAPDPTTGTFRVSSFFDIFTELSPDNGQTWFSPTSDPSSMPYNPQPPFLHYYIICPNDITVNAGSSKGAYVSYTFPPYMIYPDCPFCCNAPIGVPASGSLFPLGTTTVHVSGVDGCGEHASCQFNVTVIQSFIYSGFASWGLGAAVLGHVDVGTNQFATISNLLSSASDGFHLALGSADSALLNFEPNSVNTLTDYVVSATGLYAGDPNHQMGTGMFINGDQPMILADFSSLGATSVILEVRDDDNHLISSNILANAAALNVNNLFPPPCTNINTTSYSYWQSPDHICYRFCKYGCNCLGTNCYIERIACFRPDIAAAPIHTYLNGLQFLGQAKTPTGALTLESEEVGLFGLMHRANGQATLEPHPGVLLLDNLGSSGQDGVTLDLNNVGQLDVTLAPTMLEVQGACWQMSAAGRFNGMEDVPLGAAMLVHSVGPGGGCQVSGDFSGLGSPTTQVEVYQSGRLVGSAILPNGPVGTMPTHGNLIGCGMVLRPLPGFKALFDSPFSFLPTGGTASFSGDEIHILAAKPPPSPVCPTCPVQVQGLSEFTMQACGIGQFAILGESVQPNITGFNRPAGGPFGIDGQGAAGMTYQLQAAPALGGSSQWGGISSAVSGPDGTFHLYDTRAGVTGPQFYRTVGP